MIEAFTVLATFETDQLAKIHQNSSKEGLKIKNWLRYQISVRLKINEVKHRKVVNVFRGFKYIVGVGLGGVGGKFLPPLYKRL